LQCVAVHCSVLRKLHRHVSAHITRLILLQCVAMRCSEFYIVLHELHRHISAQITRLTHVCHTCEGCVPWLIYVSSLSRFHTMSRLNQTSCITCSVLQCVVVLPHSFICVPRLFLYVVYHGSPQITSIIYICAVTHSHEPWLKYVCAVSLFWTMTRILHMCAWLMYVWLKRAPRTQSHGSWHTCEAFVSLFRCAHMWMICVMVHSHVCHVSLRIIHMCAMSHSYMCSVTFSHVSATCHKTHSHVCCDSFTSAPRLIYLFLSMCSLCPLYVLSMSSLCPLYVLSMCSVSFLHNKKDDSLTRAP